MTSKDFNLLQPGDHIRRSCGAILMIESVTNIITAKIVKLGTSEKKGRLTKLSKWHLSLDYAHLYKPISKEDKLELL